uniref:WD repeat-containing protein 79 n=1 Tax=Syphacia muris TaxID=451379 RepID=A0A158R4Z3_9BILA
MDITAAVEELIEQLLRETSETTEGTLISDNNEGASSSNDLQNDNGSSASAKNKKTNFKQMRKGMGFLLSQLREHDTQPTSIKQAIKRPADKQLSKDEFLSEYSVNLKYSNKKKKLYPDFNLTAGHEIYRENNAFFAIAPKFGFSLDSACNNYIKCCKWNADGTVLATSSQDRKLRIFTLESGNLHQVHLAQTIPLGNLIYDICWNPLFNLLATSSKDQPIHCWSLGGTRVISFRGINEQVDDELDSAQSLCFSSNGMRLYAGYKKVIRIFDINRPGRQQKEIKTWSKLFILGSLSAETISAKEAGGQKSIISCISMNPIMSGVYAAASYGKSLALYSELSPNAECVFDACANGITHLRYSNDGNILFASGRKENFISCWDLRFPGKLLACLERPCNTNQRIYFDLEGSNRYLFSGSSNGAIFIFDISLIGCSSLNFTSYAIQAHKSVLSGISVHPELPLIATCSGQRIYPMPDFDETSDETSEYESLRHIEDLDNSLALWSFI